MMSDLDLHPFPGTDAVSGDVIVAGHSTPLLLKVTEQFCACPCCSNLSSGFWVFFLSLAFPHLSCLFAVRSEISTTLPLGHLLILFRLA
jgi:hypothetical protein